MKKITNREKIMIGFGVVVAIAIIVYFLIIPLAKSGQSSSDLIAKQERLQSVKKLKDMEPMIADLEKYLEARLGYDKITFDPRTAESSIMTQLAQMANQSEIREVEQLDIKPEKSKKKQADQRGDQNILKSVVDKMYLAQVNNEKDNPVALEEAKTISGKPSSEKGKSEELKEETKTDISKDSTGEDKKEDNASEEPSAGGKMIFPVIPKDIPDEAKQSLVAFIQNHEGKTISSEDADAILQSSNIKDNKDTDRIKKRLVTYSNRVKERKGEVLGMVNKLGIIQKSKADEKIGRFSIKMVFKSDISQLVKLLYNIQNSAKWVRIDGMNISVADRQKALLAVEIAMTASALYQ